MSGSTSFSSSLGSINASHQTPPGTPEFVQLDSKYLCKICNNVLRDAVQTICGHRFCLPCIEQKLQGVESIVCPYNEDECVSIKRDEINRDSSARREVRALLVYCTNKVNGCDKKVQWKDLQNHEENCEYRSMLCPNHVYGCDDQVTIRNTQSHTSHCQYRPYKCQFCQENVPQALKQNHETESCRKIPIPCKYNCEENPLPREEMDQHLTICPRRPQHCRYQSVGCDFQGTNEAVREHEKVSTDRHLELITMYTANMDLQSLEVRREIQDISMERDQSKRLLQDVKQQMESVKASVEDMRAQVRDVKLKIVSQTERIIHVERKVEGLAKKDTVDRHNHDLQMMRDAQNSLSERVSHIESSGTGAATAGSVAVQVQQHDRQLSLQDIRLAELDLRFQVLETATYDGILIWKIRDYSRRKQDAITGRTLSLYSQPFYTTRTGYKMCARVYLNGDGMGRGTHLSLFFVVMKGDYDNLLQWPFKQKVTLMLLDQDTGTRHLSDTFRPDPTSSSFMKPNSDMNVASGCPLFVSHAVLETRTYVKDDTIFIKVVVDTDGLQEN